MDSSMLKLVSISDVYFLFSSKNNILTLFGSKHRSVLLFLSHFDDFKILFQSE